MVGVGRVVGVVVVAREWDVVKGETFFVVVLAEDLVVEQVETISHAEPVIALLAGEAFQVVHIPPCTHHHFECWDGLVARRAETRGTKQPEVVPFTEDEVSFGEEGGSNFSQSAVTTGAFKTVFVP